MRKLHEHKEKTAAVLLCDVTAYAKVCLPTKEPGFDFRQKQDIVLVCISQERLWGTSSFLSKGQWDVFPNG
jgi:hypothetical protein